MKWLLSLLFFGGIAAGIWWALPPRAPTTNAVTVAWELADIRELGELRLLATEIACYQHVTTDDPGRGLTAVVPVRVILGMDLTRAVVRRDGVTTLVTLPTVRFLRRSSDPRRWTIWEQKGALQAPGETVSLAQLAELQAWQEADAECVRLGLIEKARQRAEAVITAWFTGLGATNIRFQR